MGETGEGWEKSMYRSYTGGYGSGRNVFVRRRRPKIGRWLLLFVLLAALACTGYTAFDNGRCTVKRQRVFVADLPEGLEGFTVLHVSDLGGRRLGTNHSELTRALKSAKWNATVCTGNMLGKDGDPFPFYELISAVGAGKPFYFIAGRSDPPAVTQTLEAGANLSEWVTGAQSRGATYVDRPVKLDVGKESVWLTEPSLLTLDLDGALAAYTQAGASGAYWQGVVSDTIAARKTMETACGLHLLLSAKPLTDASAAKLLSSADGDFVRTVDLALAGGTAGGQWRLPGDRAVWAQGTWFPQGPQSGYGYAASLLQYVSGGLGCSPESPLPAFRLFNTPEVTLITFTSQIDLDTLP